MRLLYAINPTQTELYTTKCYLRSSSISIGSGLAGFVSGFGSISPGLNFRGSSSLLSPSFCWALSLIRRESHKMIHSQVPQKIVHKYGRGRGHRYTDTYT